jgi:hypothetical protein
VARPQAHGPGWRAPPTERFPADEVRVYCACGVDMTFRWPAGQDTVRCFGCGSKFARPEHLPARPRPTWKPAPEPAMTDPKPPVAPPGSRRRLFANLALLAAILCGLAALAFALLDAGG